MAFFKARSTSQVDPHLALRKPVNRIALERIAQSQLEDAEDSQRHWSEEYFAKWLALPQDGTLGTIPLVVLTRSNGQYVDGEYEISAAQLESERKEGQRKLARLSTNSRQLMIASGHNMELEAPDQVVDALRLIVDVVRHK